MKKQLLAVGAGALLSFSLFHGSVDAASYNVKPGDTLWGISKSYDTSVYEIKKLNNLSSSLIYVGQTLQLPGEDVGNSNHTTAQQSTITEPVEKTSEATVTYKVVRGDYLSSIGAKFGVSYQSIMKLNGLTSTLIYPGQKLVIKQGDTSSTTPKENVETTNTKPAEKVEEKKVEPSASVSYMVKSGDSLWKIASEYNTTVSALKSLNGLNGNIIYVGQVLKVSNSVQVEAEATSETRSPVQTSYSQAFNGNQLASDARALIGTRYQWAGTTPSGFDCSGFIYYVINKQTVFPRMSTASYWSEMEGISNPDIGDFVYFETYKKGPSHMGIYVGNNEFIHASSSRGVMVSNMKDSYWGPKYLGAKRLVK